MIKPTILISESVLPTVEALKHTPLTAVSPGQVHRTSRRTPEVKVNQDYVRHIRNKYGVPYAPKQLLADIHSLAVAEHGPEYIHMTPAAAYEADLSLFKAIKVAVPSQQTCLKSSKPDFKQDLVPADLASYLTARPSTAKMAMLYHRLSILCEIPVSYVIISEPDEVLDPDLLHYLDTDLPQEDIDEILANRRSWLCRRRDKQVTHYDCANCKAEHKLATTAEQAQFECAYDTLQCLSKDIQPKTIPESISQSKWSPLI